MKGEPILKKRSHCLGLVSEGTFNTVDLGLSVITLITLNSITHSGRTGRRRGS